MSKKRFINNNKGMTLVEAIISIALVAVCALMLFTGFGSVSKIFIYSIDKENSSANAYAQLEQQNGTGATGQVSFDVDGAAHSAVSGNYKTYTSADDGGVSFTAFEVD